MRQATAAKGCRPAPPGGAPARLRLPAPPAARRRSVLPDQGAATALRAVLLNCTLKKSPQVSNTQALMDKVVAMLEAQGVECDCIRVVDHDVRFGVTSDEGGGDEWPLILERILAADIVVLGTPIWFERRRPVPPLYNEVGGVVVTGNEDGAHDAAGTTLFNLSQLGCTIPPNADTYWVGDAGPGPSFIEANGWEHAYTRKTATWMAHNLVHMARLLAKNPIPPEGHTVQCWMEHTRG